MNTPSILIFSPSNRRVWLSPPSKWLNPSYWLITRLASDLAEQFVTYTATDSLEVSGRLLPYKGQKVDAIISIGAAYNPATCKCTDYDPAYAGHDRIFNIAKDVRRAMAQGKPLHINLCVDVRQWFPELTTVFGTEPDVYVTEQEMKWQQVGFLANNKFFNATKRPKQDMFVFTGGAKTRQEKLKAMTDTLTLPGHILGGGWDAVELNPQFSKLGFMQYIDSIQYMLAAKWGAVVHEDRGDASNWITAKLFEHLGSRTVGFIHPGYDGEGWYVPKDYALRAGDCERTNWLVETKGYEWCLNEQSKLIDPEWSDYRKFYLLPFLTRIKNELQRA